MASIAATARAVEASKVSSTYERFAGICAILAGGLTLVYSVSFIFLINETAFQSEATNTAYAARFGAAAAQHRSVGRLIGG